jgi:hypothetical protein
MLISFGGVFTLLAIGLWLWALFDSITAPAEKVRNLPKGVWVILILILLPIADLGAIAWFLLGRPREMAGTPRTGRWQDSGSAQPRPGSQRRRVIAPDDDPDFLRGLNKPKPDDDPRL